MLKHFRIENGRVAEAADPGSPIYLFSDLTEAERSRLIQEFRLDEHTLSSALDPDELPRMDPPGKRPPNGPANPKKIHSGTPDYGI